MTTSEAALPLELGLRSGWPDSLRFLLQRYPRAIWPGHRNLGQLGQFWLQRHQMFKELAQMLLAGTQELIAGRLDAATFNGWFAPRFAFFVQELHGHHQIEDQHYFPVFMRAEPKLRLGFVVLEQDHDTIHAALDNLVAASEALVRALVAEPAMVTARAEAMAAAIERFLPLLGRHLEDEEDLLIPLILERGDATIR